MDRNTTGLYETLGISKAATPGEAYRRLALRYHPDKNPDSSDQFKDISHAYEVLGDVQKRRVYDKYGELGLSMMETMAGPLFDPAIESVICTVILVLDLILLLFVVFFVFVAAKIDQQVDWRWATVWIPLWLIHLFIGSALVRYILSSPRPEDHDPDDEAMQGDETTKRTDRSQQHRHLLTRGVLMIYFILAIVFQLFIILALDHHVRWSAATIFSPYFALEGLHFCLAVADYGIALHVVSVDATTRGLVYHGMVLLCERFGWLTLRLGLCILIMLRIDGFITCSWYVVFIPLYLVAVKYAVQLGLCYRRFCRLPQPDVAQQGKVTVSVGVVVLVVLSALVYALVGLVARRLDGMWYVSMITIFVPIFIILAIVICCCGCCLPCLMMISALGDMDDLESAQVFIDPNRRITQSGEN